MAVKEAPQFVRDYWPKYRRRSLALMLGIQALLSVGIVYGLIVLGFVKIEDWIALAVIAGAILAVMLLNVAVFNRVTKPLKILADALTHAAGERSVSTPPHLNSPLVKNSGLRPLLETIYKLGYKATTDTVQDEEQAKSDELKETASAGNLVDALSESSVGVALLDTKQNIIFTNQAVPLRETANGTRELELEFYTDQTLASWIAECEEKAVHAEKIWHRIASKPVGQDGRKIYDIAASYHKDSKVPISVVLMEKTDEYTPEDEDLNFIAFAAHELRGPVTVIRGYLDTLEDELGGMLDEEQEELFKRLIVSANRLSGYINNILNSSRFDRRHLQVRLAEARLDTIYATIADDMQLRASTQNRLLTVDLPAGLPTVAADVTSVGEVLGNLIDNAIKYSSEGGIVRVSAEQKGDHVEIEVEDHGIGMPANVVKNLFHKFYRSHRSRETVAGTGIGLYISKAIIESHGGTMGVRSVEGQGSTFTFTLPTYASVAEKLSKTDGDNRLLISNHSGSWIRNHGAIRG